MKGRHHGTTAQMEQDISLDHMFDSSLRICGQPVEFRTFDVQWCGSLNEEWLAGAAQSETIAASDVRWMLDQGLLRLWKNRKGEEGFTLYTPQQVAVLKRLLDTKRYELDELRHIMADWDDYVEAIIMDEPPYDDFDVSDYEHFKRRAQECIEHFEFDEERYRERPSYLSPEQYIQQRQLVADRLAYWRRVGRIFAQKTDEELSPRLREGMQRQLFHLRWLDEFVRISMAQQFEAGIVQGYSTEVSFDGFSTQGGEVTLSRLNWVSTLRRFSETRKEGKLFPLRTPSFNVTERGIELLGKFSPEEFSTLHAEFHLDELFQLLEEFGPDLWVVKPPSIGDAKCPECNENFERTTSGRVYCTERCRKRAKSRRWRERDPERARLCQARYWNGYTDPH